MKKREKVSMATVRKERDAWLEVDKAFLLDVFREKENAYRNQTREFQKACYEKRKREWEALVMFQAKLAVHGRMSAPTRISFPETDPTN